MAENLLLPVVHPPHNPDIAPCDFYLFGFLKNKMKGIKLKSEADLRDFLESQLETITSSTAGDVFKSWIKRQDAMIQQDGRYVSSS